MSQQLECSVSELVSVVNQTLEYAYSGIAVYGEVSAANAWRDRLLFFTIKDDASSVDCMLPLQMLGTEIEVGMQVLVHGSLSITKKGKFSLNARSIQPIGEGSVNKAFVLLQKKLAAEGLFEQDRKRHLPQYPEKIAYIGASSSAAYADFIRITSERWPLAEISVYETQVQGTGAEEQIVSAIQTANSQTDLAGILVLTRGGGSIEDLHAFNDERVVRALASSRIPTISGVGHESDTTLVDFVSDVRASTPTNAAQLATPDVTQELATLARLEQDIFGSIAEKIESENKNLLAKLQKIISHTDIGRRKLFLETSYTNIVQYSTKFLQKQQRSLRSSSQILHSHDVQKWLHRGFSVIRKDGKIIASSDGLNAHDRLMVQLSNTQIETEIIHV